MQLPLQLLYEPPVPAAFMGRAVGFIRDRLVLLLQTPFIMLREFAFVIPITLDNLLPKMPMVAL